MAVVRDRHQLPANLCILQGTIGHLIFVLSMQVATFNRCWPKTPGGGEAEVTLWQDAVPDHLELTGWENYMPCASFTLWAKNRIASS